MKVRRNSTEQSPMCRGRLRAFDVKAIFAILALVSDIQTGHYVVILVVIDFWWGLA